MLLNELVLGLPKRWVKFISEISEKIFERRKGMINLYLVRDGLGKNGVASTKVEEFIEKNKPENIVAKYSTILSLEGVYIQIGSEKKCLLTSFGTLGLRRRMREEGQDDKPIIVRFEPCLEGESIIVFNPIIEYTKKEEAVMDFIEREKLILELTKSMNLKAILSEPLIELPLSGKQLWEVGDSLCPVFFFKSEAAYEVSLMLEKLNNLITWL